MRYLLDTNIVIEHIGFDILSNIPPGTTFALSTITEAELFRYAGMSQLESSAIDEFLLATTIMPVDSIIARRAASLGRTRKTEMLDLLIAATALELGVPLVTKNVSDFRGIPSLRVISSITD